MILSLMWFILVDHVGLNNAVNFEMPITRSFVKHVDKDKMLIVHSLDRI